MLRCEYERNRLGLSQRKLAHLAGIEAITLNKIERGRLHPYPAYREPIAKALGWSGDTMELFEEVKEFDSLTKNEKDFVFSIAPTVWPHIEDMPCTVTARFVKFSENDVRLNIKIETFDTEGCVESFVGDYFDFDPATKFGGLFTWEPVAVDEGDTNA